MMATKAHRYRRSKQKSTELKYKCEKQRQKGLKDGRNISHHRVRAERGRTIPRHTLMEVLASKSALNDVQKKRHSRWQKAKDKDAQDV